MLTLYRDIFLLHEFTVISHLRLGFVSTFKHATHFDFIFNITAEQERGGSNT
jgi:hypothetical protein